MNTKEKLSGFAAETLANISKRFRLLHGQLQNAELQAIEKLRESSLSPQMQLNAAMSQLNGYEKVLKNLRQMLHGGVDERFEFPQDIWLKDVIMLINEHLEIIPTYVQVTKVDSNPYHFNATKDNLPELLDRHFICEFVDPQIKVRFNNEFNHESIVSSINHTQESCVDNSWGQSHQAGPKAAAQRGTSARGQKQQCHIKKVKSSSSSMTDSASDRQMKQRNFVRTFSAMDISQFNSGESTSSTLLTQVGDWFRSDAIVHVRSIRSPEDFYVQCIHAAQRIREHLDTFAESADCQPPSSIVVGQQYITYHNQTEMDRWHRALVSQKAEKRGIYNVLLPDIGLTFKVHSSNFRQLPDHLAMMPYAAVRCSLKQLMPSQGGSVWDPQASAFLKQVVQNNPVQINVLRSLGPQFYEVDLITTNYESNISVRESFLYTGMARARNGYGAAQILKPLQLQALHSQRLPKYVPHVGDVLMIQLLHVQHPQEFYVMAHELELKRRTQQRDLQNFMDNMSLAHLEPVYLGRLQLACVLQLEGQWHRASIERLLPEGYVLVRLVDSGVTKKICWDQLFKLPNIFWSQELATKCCLADVETLQEHGYTWTPSAIAAFQQLTSNPMLQMEVIGVRDNVAHVVLNFTRSGTDANSNNVAAILVAQGHCKSSGESSRVIKLQPVRQSQLDADTRRLIEEAKAPFEEPLALHDKADKMNRSTIEVLHVQHPGEFYVTLSHFVTAIAELRTMVQATAAERYQNCALKLDWQPGDMCYVRIMASHDLEMLWHRGQIVSCAEDAADKYNVRLRDIGELIQNVPVNCLATMDEGLERIASSAVCCRLYGILPNGAHWSPEAIEFFKTQLEAFSSLHVTGQGPNGDHLVVILWGANTEISGPFSPARLKFTNINELLVQTGWALSDQKHPLKKQLELTDSNSSSLCSQDEEDDARLNACLQSVDRIGEAPILPKNKLSQLGFEHNDEMPPLALLNDFNTNTTTTGSTKPPLAWLQPRECTKCLFNALPTYVNYQCEIYLTLATDEPFIAHMRNLLTTCFKPLLKQQVPSVYVVGQPVVVTYHVDERFYRGIVESSPNAKGEYKVYYVDYGNVEKVLPSEMLPYAPFPRLNSMCWRMVIHGVQPRQKTYTRTIMDTVHNTVVMKLSSVRVVEPKGANGLPQCQIKVGDLDIATMMVNNEMAVRTPQQDEQQLKQQREEALKSFKLFDQLLQLGESQPKTVTDQNNTTAQPPPAKKKFMMNSRKMQHLDSEEDFDCKEAAKQQLQTSVNFDEDDSDDDNENEKNSADGFSDDYVIEEIDEGIANQGEENTATSVPQQISFMPPQGISAMDQLRQRIQLRFKDRLETAHFSPMDTSTERSYQDGVGCFKTQCLPPGVKNFPCSVDKVVSATELQVSPQLTEFAKQEIVLTQETSALIQEAARLDPVQVDAMCLARFSPDKQWYRAIVKELHQAANQATVFYIDFHDTKMVPYSDLKVMPNQLFMFPQRSFRVKLYGIKLNRSFADTSVRQALQACLCKHPTVFARVHYPMNYNDDSSDDEYSDPNSSSNSVKRGFKLLEVDLFENKHKTELLYKPLIDSQMFLLK